MESQKKLHLLVHTLESDIEIHCSYKLNITGHLLLGDPVLECLRSGDWSINPPRCKYIDCEKIPEISGGRVQYLNGSTHLGSEIEFKCNKNYRLDGNDRVTCQESGSWSNVSPTCTEIRCPVPEKVNNTIFRQSTRGRVSDKKSYGVGTILNYR